LLSRPFGSPPALTGILGVTVLANILTDEDVPNQPRRLTPERKILKVIQITHTRCVRKIFRELASEEAHIGAGAAPKLRTRCSELVSVGAWCALLKRRRYTARPPVGVLEGLEAFRSVRGNGTFGSSGPAAAESLLVEIVDNGVVR